MVVKLLSYQKKLDKRGEPSARKVSTESVTKMPLFLQKSQEIATE